MRRCVFSDEQLKKEYWEGVNNMKTIAYAHKSNEAQEDLATLLQQYFAIQYRQAVSMRIKRGLAAKKHIRI